MRLTLRTLLAYMDEILDPADQAELAARIDASPVANELVHRGRDVTRRQRLGAPGIDDASEPDPNKVAEYLDNVLPADQVAEFEQKCLDSDMELAEVVACHHILAMVLSEKADIDPESRRRLYAIPEVAELMRRQSATDGATPASVAAVAASDTSDDEIREVPDYLLAGESSFQRWLPAIAALLLLGVVSFLAFRPGGFLRPGPVAVVDPQPDAEAPAQPIEGEGEVGDDAAGEMGDETNEPQDPAELEETAVDTEAIVGGADTDTESDEQATDVKPNEGPDADDANSDDPAEATDAEALGEAAATSEETMTSEGSETVEEATASETDASDETVSDDQTGDTVMDDTDSGEPAVVEVDPSGQAAEPQLVGLFSGARQVLLRYNDIEQNWFRVPVRDEIMTGDRLLSLPTYRPVVALGQLTMEMSDGTQVRINPPTADGTLSATLLYGRVILSNTGAEEQSLELQVGGVDGSIQLDRGASLAVDANRPFVPGSDPAEQLAPIVAQFFAPAEGVRWSTDIGDIDATEPTMWVTVGKSIEAPEPFDSAAADWLYGRELTMWEREATVAIEEQLDTERPIWTQLGEIVRRDMKDQSALAAIGSSYVGHFDPFVKALADENQKLAWAEEIRALRDAISRSSAQAEKVRGTLLERHGEDRGAVLYELLVGYSGEQIGREPEDWPGGALATLVDYLDSPHLEVRVLASHNLEQITGRRGVYNPAGLQRSRESAAARLRNRLEKGDLKPVWAE